MHLESTNVKSLHDRKTDQLKATIYIPTNPRSNSQTIEQDITRFKNSLRAIENHHAFNKRELGPVISEIRTDLQDNIEFWKHQGFGLAIFFDRDGYQYSHMPFEVEEAHYLSDHFVTGPLLIAFSIDTSFYLLDINLNQPRLYAGAHGQLKEIDQVNMPGSFEEEEGRDEYDTQLQHQTTTGTALHGHEDSEAMNEDMRKYFRKIAAPVDEYLGDDSRPLVLSGTDSRVGNFRKQLHYGRVVDEALEGNYEKAAPQELYQLSSAVVFEELNQDIDAAVNKLLEAKPGFIADSKNDMMNAAEMGNAAILFIPAYRRTHDSVQPGSSEDIVLQLPEDIEDIEPIISKVLKQDGVIQAVEIGAYDILDKPKVLCRF